MDADSTVQPSTWHRLLPLLIFLIGAIITFLLWQDTRAVLAGENNRSLTQVHEAQTRQLQAHIRDHENSLSQLAVSLSATTLAPEAALQTLGLPLLQRNSDWRHLTLARTSADFERLEVRASVPRGDSPWPPGQDLAADPRWEPLLQPAQQKPGIRTTDRFSANDDSNEERQALVTPLRLDNDQRYLLIVAFDPGILVDQALTLAEPISFRTSVIDTEQDERGPLFITGEISADGPVRETSLEIGDRSWLVRSQSLTDLYEEGRSTQLLSAILAGGLALSLAVALLFWQLNRQRLEAQVREQHLNQRWDRDLKALENKRLEKEVLSRSLSDSEQRTRDFLHLGAGIGFELDDDQSIGYVSRQIQSLLGHAPGDLAGTPMVALLPPSEHQRLVDALNACRQQREATRLDACLIDSDGRERAFRMRFCTITDALSHCQGYRGIAWPRYSED